MTSSRGNKGRRCGSIAREYDVALAAPTPILQSKPNFIVSAVTASQASRSRRLRTRREEERRFFLDFNSASPGAKQRAAS